MDSIHTLLVEDTARRRRSMRSKLASARPDAFTFEHRKTIESAANCVRNRLIDVVLLDPDLPDATGIDAVMNMRAAAPNVPIVVGVDDESMALESLRAHADDYVLRPRASRTVLELAIRRAFERRHARRLLGGTGESKSAIDVQLMRLIAASTDGLAAISTRGDLLYANPAALRMFGRLTTFAYRSLFVLPPAPSPCSEVPLGDGRVIEIHVMKGEWSDEQVWFASMFDVTQHRLALAQLDERRAQVQLNNDRLMKLASVDPLTETLNRRGLSQELAIELRRRSRTGAPLSAVLIDCDDFKHINESLGYVVGDSVLKGIAQRLRDGVRPSDHIGRIGGDEFLLLLSDTRFQEAYQVADRLRVSLADAPMPSSHGLVSVTASVGVELLNERTDTIEQILDQTQAALQKSKHRGKNRISTSHNGTCEIFSASEASIELLCERASYRVTSRPIVRLSDQSVFALELIPRGPPGPFEDRRDFFRVAHERDRLSQVDALCIRVCLDHVLQRRGSTPFHLRVLPSTLLEETPDWLAGILSSQTANTRFCVEISDQHIVGDASRLRPHVESLRSAGIDVAIVETGLGRSALETLVLLKPHFVALDPHFVRHASQAGHDDRALRHTVEVVTSLGCQVIADGIESANELELFRTSGVAFGRGPLWPE